jgi:hypothetical protein
MRQKKSYDEQPKDNAYAQLIGEYDNDTKEEEIIREDE